jgi:tetratricopeptide (TPR) repeat protein
LKGAGLRKPQILAFGLCLAVPAAWPQSSPQPRELTVIVVNAHTDPSAPVQGARVSLSFVAGSEKVVDARDATNRSGQALLLVSPEAAQRGDLRVEITGASELVVFEPADGQLNGLPGNITVKLLPKGSVLLLGPPQIEAMLQRLSMQSRNKTQQIQALKDQVAAARTLKPDGLTASMTEWAKTNGFETADVDKQVRQWAENIQRRKDQVTATENALAELALNHYEVAAPMFHQVAAGQLNAFKESQKRALDAARREFLKYVESEYQSANAYQMSSQYHQATLVLEGVREQAAAEHQSLPDDAAFRYIFLDTVSNLADARRVEGEVGEGGVSSAMLNESISDYKALLEELSAPEDRPDWASTQNKLAFALLDLGIRSTGTQANDLLARAVQAFRSALEVMTRANQPQDWAAIENNLGLALMTQGAQASGEQGTALLDRAVQAFRAALEVSTKGDQPQQWAATNSNLATVLMQQGERIAGAQSTQLLAQAVQADRAALEVQTKASDPRSWAQTQSNLAIALTDQGERSSGAPALELLASAVAANRAALEVYTQADMPQEWARVQTNLGNALSDRGQWSNGAPGMDLLAQAASAFRAALQVRTKENLPQGWATTQNNLGFALANLGERSNGEQAANLFSQAIEAYRAALEVDTRADLPVAWALAQNNLGIALFDQANGASGQQAADLLAQAVFVYRSVLQVRTKADTPQDWAATQNNLGTVLMAQAQQDGEAHATELLAQAVAAYSAALEIYTRADNPLGWAKITDNLGMVQVDRGDFSGASKYFEACLEVFPDDPGFLQNAISVYQDNLYRYDRARELVEHWLKVDPSPDGQLAMVQADLTTSRFDDCQKRAAGIDDGSFTDPVVSMSLIRDAMKFACQWGSGSKLAAQQTAQLLVTKAAQLENTGWVFAGTRHFLASSPAFELGHPSWDALFERLEKGDGAAMVDALHRLAPVIKQ